MEEDTPNNFDSGMRDQLIEPMVNLNEFCRHRIEEVLMLTDSVRESPFRGQAFQRLPKHMRRRQMSHHMKRLPKSLRASNSSTSKDEVPQPPKRPSRKFRRRPKNLLLEYNRRQKSNAWLETHIWHSKRFSMISKWGYKLPERPTNKSFRACYRAATQHCFISDISYYNCLELKGPGSKLLEGLQKCISSDIGLTFAAKMFIDGSREGSVVLFHPGSYPYRVIGRVTFLWKPCEKEEEFRTIWIFSHPTYYQEIVKVLKTMFELNKCETEGSHTMVNITTEEKEKITEGEAKKEEEKMDEEKMDEGKMDEEKMDEEKMDEEKMDEESRDEEMEEKEKEQEKEQEQGKEKEKEKEQEQEQEKEQGQKKEKKEGKKKKEVKCEPLNKEVLKLETKNIPYERVPKYKNSDGSITMNLLKDVINRFRLTGPLALSIISEAFDVDLTMKSSSTPEENPPAEGKKDKTLKRKHSLTGEGLEVTTKKMKTNSDEEVAGQSLPKKEDEPWWIEYYKNEFHYKCLESQKQFYKNLKNLILPSDVPPNVVFSLVVRDPRLTLPQKRMKSLPEAQGSSPDVSVDSSVSYSPLWDTSTRDKVSFKKMPTSEINEARSKLIVPGSDPGFLLQDRQARVPIIVIQRTDITSADHSHDTSAILTGFDVIVPAGWAMPFWLSLIFRGARPGGLREMKGLLLEANILNDYHQPDSESGESENLESSRNFKNLHFKYPPNNRPNFAKLGVQTPFYFPWKVLVKDWRLRTHPSEGKNNDLKYYVLRDRKKLSELNTIFENLHTMLKSQTKSPWVNIFKEEELDCLIPVAVETKGKGSPKEHAMICLPSVEDIRGLKTKDYTTPNEVLHVDMNEETRKHLKLEHAQLLKSLKRKRKRCREKEKEEEGKKPVGEKLDSSQEEKDDGTSSKDAIDEYIKKVESLWLEDPEGITSVIDSCSRTILGFVVLGNFSFTKARGLGLGYVTLRGLLFFLKRCYDAKSLPVILYRNITSLKYRLGTLRLCMN